MRAEQELQTSLIAEVRDALAAEASRRSASGETSLAEDGQRALAVQVLRSAFRRMHEEAIATRADGLSPTDEADIERSVLAVTVGRGPFDVLLADQSVEDIVATRHDLLFTYHSDGSCRRVHDRYWTTDHELMGFLAHVARTAGRTERAFNAQQPLLTMRIGDGLRLAAQAHVAQHTTFCLRRNTLGDVSLAQLADRGMFPPLLGELLAALARAPEMRVAIGGATGAGKTTLARAMLNGLPPEHRLVIIEDTAEMDLFDPIAHPNVESWERREPNSEGEGEIGLGELVRHGLRNRPDLLIVGEVRGSDAAIPMLEAMTHGQASLTTVHADDAAGALAKLALFLGKGDGAMAPAAAHNNLSMAVDFVVHVDRGTAGGRFVSEVIEVAGFDGTQVLTNTLYDADDGDGDGDGRFTMRLTEAHVRKLRRAGFDPARLGGVRV